MIMSRTLNLKALLNSTARLAKARRGDAVGSIAAGAVFASVAHGTEEPSVFMAFAAFLGMFGIIATFFAFVIGAGK